MKKFAIGCLSVIGGVMVISVIIAVITGIPSEPTTDQTGAGNGQSLIEAELIQAQNQGLIAVSASGAGSLERIKLTVTSKSDEPLELAILPGTIFAAQSASVQSMVVTVEKVILLYPYETVGPVNLNAACASMQLDMPGDSDTLTLSTAPVSEDLIKLLNLSAFHSETTRVRQFAIWTITDNPERNDYVGIGTFGFGSGPSDEEMAEIRSLFEKAGIDTDKYRALS